MSTRLLRIPEIGSLNYAAPCKAVFGFFFRFYPDGQGMHSDDGSLQLLDSPEGRLSEHEGFSNYFWGVVSLQTTLWRVNL